MKRALITFGIGKAAELKEIALPSFEAFAEAHDYELRVYEPEPHEFWPIPWMKIACLEDALADYEEVLWVDSDIVITDPSEDLPVGYGKWQALAIHHTHDGEVPNTGVWLCRKPMRNVLSKMWDMREYRNHPWWEQGAVMSLLGYDPWARPTVFRGATALYERTEFLSTEWNSHPWDEAEHPRFRHATMHPDRAASMREWAAA
jgi:hypothetical protein